MTVNDAHKTVLERIGVKGARITVLSGAGISAESGVPTFRDDAGGLWKQFDPTELANIDAWRANPARVWAWYVWRYHLMSEIEPNAGHRAVAAWQEQAEVTVVTQNVDDLHERAGSRTVHHVHGSLNEFRCHTCGTRVAGPVAENNGPVGEQQPPACECGGLIRPGVVWFGEELPDEVWRKAVEAVTTADLLVVVGTSGLVYPVAALPDLALIRGIAVIEVNPETTALSDYATVTLRQTATEALPGLLSRQR